MPNFGFDDAESARRANRIFYGRSCLLGVGVALLVPILAFAKDAPNWRDLDGWYAMAVDAENPFVCQMPAASGCEPGWSQGGDRTKCWLLGGSPYATFSDASASCAASGGQLAVIETGLQNEDVHTVCGALQPCWIGLSQNRSAVFRWADGSRPQFSNWEAGEPEGAGSGQLAAVLGMARVARGAAAKELVAALVLALANLCVLMCISVAFLLAVWHRQPRLLLCATLADGGCAFCCCLSLIVTAAAVIAGDASLGRFLVLALTFFEVAALAAVAGLSARLNPKLATMPSRGHVHVGEVVVAHVVPQVVIGRSVAVRPREEAIEIS